MPYPRRTPWLADKSSLGQLQLRSWAELLGDPGVQDAIALLQPKPAPETLRRAGLDPADAPQLDTEALAARPLAGLQRLAPGLRRGLPLVLGARTVGDLVRAAAIVRQVAALDTAAEPDPFNEAPSAPRELIPRATGAIAATARYTQFVRERPLSLADLGLQLRVDASLVRTVDARLLAAFQFDPTPILHLGYMAGFRQEWVNDGTFLGEPLQSIGLAPGETRRIAVIDWQRSVATQRGEDTDISEALDNTVSHQRSLGEVVSSTAREIQSGGTSLAAGTLASAAGTVAAGALVGGLGGAAIGAAAGSLAAGVGAVPGSLVGLAVGAVAGGVGVAVTGAANGQLGMVESDTSGQRDVSASFSQRVNDVSTQKATALRSVMSTVVVTGEEAERESLSTRAIANHNHAHALTIQYFEVLQHYRVRVRLAEHQALLFLPMQPLVFDADLVLAHWDTLRLGFSGARRAAFDAMVAHSRQLSASPLLDPAFDPAAALVDRIIVSGVPLGLRLNLRSRNDALSDLAFRRLATSRTMRLDLSEQAARVDEIQGLRVRAVSGTPSARDLQDLARGVPDELSVVVRVDTEPATTLHLSIPNEGEDGRVSLDLRAALERARDDAREAEDAADDLTALVAAVNARPYQFTRLLVLSLEPEQLREVIEALVVVSTRQGAGGGGGGGAPVRVVAAPGLDRTGLIDRLAADLRRGGSAAWREAVRGQFQAVARQDGVPLSSLVDTQPFGLSDGMLALQLRHLRAQGSTALDFARVSKLLPDLEALRDYPAELQAALPALAEQASDESIFLPTGGHFAEAILGRSNAAERLDGTRHIFWHELPNPLVASEIAALAAGSRAQSLPGTAPTEAGTVLSPAAPTSLPDPALGAAALAVLGQQNLFRDMSKTSELVGVLSNLSGLAGSMANQAGQLAGAAQQQALQQAGALAQQVAQLTERMFQTVNGGGLPADASATQRAVAGNRLQDLAQSPLPALPSAGDGAAPVDTNGAVARSFGAPLGAAGATGGSPTGTPGGSSNGSTVPGAGGEQSGFLLPAEPFASRSEADGVREALPEALRAPTDTGVAIREDLRNTPQGVAAEAERRIAASFVNELLPLLQNASADDATLDQALRLTLDLQATHELAGLAEPGPLARAAGALADGWRASRQRAVAAIAGTGTLAALPRLETLVAIAQAGFDRTLGLSDAETSLPQALAQAGVDMTIDRFDRPAEVAAGQAVDLAVRVLLRIGAGAAPAPLANARVIFSALETLEGEVSATTAADGFARARVTHDPLHLGADANGPRTPNLGLRVAVLALHPQSVAVQADALAEVPGRLTLTLLNAVNDDDGSNALAGTVVVPQPARPILATMQLLSAGVPVRQAPVTTSVNGAATLRQFSTRSGDADSRGLISLTLVPGAAGSGVSFVAVSAQAPDGRMVTGRIDVQSP